MLERILAARENLTEVRSSRVILLIVDMLVPYIVHHTVVPLRVKSSLQTALTRMPQIIVSVAHSLSFGERLKELSAFFGSSEIHSFLVSKKIIEPGLLISGLVNLARNLQAYSVTPLAWFNYGLSLSGL